MNEVRISGRATRDAVRVGRGQYKFSIAVGGGKKRDSDEHYPTEFFDVTCWHDSAQHIRKGQVVLILGRLRQNTWEKDGQRHSRVEIVANEFPGTEPKEAQSPLKYPIPTREPRQMKVAEHRPVTAEDPIDDSDVPF